MCNIMLCIYLCYFVKQKIKQIFSMSHMDEAMKRRAIFMAGYSILSFAVTGWWLTYLVNGD